MRFKKRTIKYVFLLLLLCNVAYSASIDEIRQKIDLTTQNKINLEKEIAEYQKQLKEIGDQANTLSKAVKTLEATEKKTALDIKLTENNIQTTGLQIESLAFEINNKENDIKKNSTVIYQTLNEIDQYNSTSIIESLLSHRDLADFWSSIENLYRIQNKIKEKLSETKIIKKDLETDKKDSEDKKIELISLKSDLEDKKKILEINKKEKSSLLAETKNKEANYKKLLAEKQALADAFDKELTQFESELRLTIDPNSIPKAVKGILSWPLTFVKITQDFGNTDFANRNAQLYNGKGHNGIDLRAAIGTTVKAARDGIIKGTGNTDAEYKCYSYGKWVLIEHNNGLSTLYAHLSLINVTVGQKVYTGQTIGYSGNTGASTAPHLHFGVYASQGVKIMQYTNSLHCKNTFIPIGQLADFKAYLNPLQYLPTL